MASRQKVFGIGFQKTATSSLAAALYILGYNVTGFFGAHDADIGEKVYAKGDGWEKLCPFVGQEIPPLEFPSQNGTADRSNQVMKRGINYLKRKLPLNNDSESVHDQLLAQIQRKFKRIRRASRRNNLYRLLQEKYGRWRKSTGGKWSKVIT